MNFAVMNHNIVTNLIVADSLEVAEAVSNFTCIEYANHTDAGIGWTYDGDKFIAPVIASPTEEI